VKIQLLPSSFDTLGCASLEQRLTCFLIDDTVAIDAGSIAIGISEKQRADIRDIIVTHPHMDHIASLPIFIDDLFASLREPIRIHATQTVIDALERDVFNWTVYPRFSELENDFGKVMEYVPFREHEDFRVSHLTVRAIPVNHIVPTVGLILSDGQSTIAMSSDTAETEDFWQAVNRLTRIDALVIESSFPNSMAKLAEVSRHLTPLSMSKELEKLKHSGMDVLAVHLKPVYREKLVEEINALRIPRLQVMEAGRTYEW
jgi:cAMP phosphodiesterase